MKKFIHPSYGFLLIVIFIYLFFIDVSVSVSVWIPSISSPVFWAPVGIAIFLGFCYLVYGIVDFSLRLLKEYGGLRAFFDRLKEEEVFRKVISSYVGSFLNLLMSVIYFVAACSFRSFFDLLAAQYLFCGFIIRSLLLYITFNRKKNWELQGFRLASCFTIFFGLAMLSLTLVYNFSGVLITRSYLFTVILGIYALIKILAAIASLRIAIHDKDVTFLSYTITSMSMAFYTFFMFIVTVPTNESVEEAMPRDAFIGYLLSAITIVVGVLCLLHYRRLKYSYPIDVEMEETPDKKEGVLVEKDGVLREKTPLTPGEKTVRVVKKKE